MPIDDRTTNRSYKLPNPGNFLADDVARLRDALNAIDADVFTRYTKTEVEQLITNLINGSPGALDTLNELADALGDDPNFAATVATQLALKADAASVYSKAEADARYVQGSTQSEMVFIATANQSVFTLSTAVINKPSALVTVDGVVQPTSEYSLNMAGTQLTLSEGVPVGTIVRVLALGVASQEAPADDTVTAPKLRDGAVTPPKLDAAVAASLVPSGTVQFYASTVAPTGWLKANGAAVSRTAYAALFTAIGTIYGAGDGATTFNLPDLRGEFPRGWDDGRGIDSNRAIGTAQAQAYLSHNHGVSDPGHAHGVWDPGHAHYLNYQIPLNTGDTDRGGTSSIFSIDNSIIPTTAANTTGIQIYGSPTYISIQNSGGTETRPRNIALLAIIKF